MHWESWITSRSAVTGKVDTRDRHRDGTRPAHEVLAWSGRLVEPALRTAVDSFIYGTHRWLPPRVVERVRPPGTVSRGKAIWPALALLCAQAVGGTPGKAVPAAVAVELAHNHSLLHDDVMDGDLTVVPCGACSE
jgi:geranylgeranyl diphosphate synthase type I